MTPLVQVRGLRKEFRLGHGARAPVLRALDGIDLDIARGETLGLVGESGSGKSTLGRCLVGLYPQTAGTIRFDGQDTTGVDRAGRRALRRRMQLIFQDPYAALNPRMTVGATLSEHLAVQGFGERAAIQDRIAGVLELCGLPASYAARHPHEMSGGQRQRVVIARAIATSPDFVVADEPVSALDVSTRAQIINLLRTLQATLGLTSLFISHDLAVVAHTCRRIAVMYLGRIVELAPRDALFARAAHPYTRALLSAVPIPDPAVERARIRVPLLGEPPDPTDAPAGCGFHPRCPLATSICRAETPAFRPMGDGHVAACHHAQDTVPVHAEAAYAT